MDVIDLKVSCPMITNQYLRFCIP